MSHNGTTARRKKKGSQPKQGGRRRVWYERADPLTGRKSTAADPAHKRGAGRK